MNLNSEKSYLIAGSILAICFTLLTIFLLLGLRSMQHTDSMLEIVQERLSEEGRDIEEAYTEIKTTIMVLNVFLGIGVFWFVIEIIALILSIKVNKDNKDTLSIILIVIGFIHILGLRIFAVILMTVGGFKLLTKKPPIINQMSMNEQTI